LVVKVGELGVPEGNNEKYIRKAPRARKEEVVKEGFYGRKKGNKGEPIEGQKGQPQRGSNSRKETKAPEPALFGRVKKRTTKPEGGSGRMKKTGH